MTLAPFFVYKKGEEKILKGCKLKNLPPTMMVFFEGVKNTTFEVVILNKCGEKRWYATV